MRRFWLLALGAVAFVSAAGAAKAPTKHVPVKTPSAGNVTIAHFVLTAKSKKAGKHPPSYKLGNPKALGNDVMVVASVKKMPQRSGKTHYDVTVVVAQKNPAPPPVPDAQRGGVPPSVDVVVTGPYAETGFAQLPNTIGPNATPPWKCNPTARYTSWYAGSDLRGANPTQLGDFGCLTAWDLPAPLGIPELLGAPYCGIGDAYFTGSKTEHVTTFSCDFPVKGFKAHTSSDTKITNSLPPMGFSCTVSATVYVCLDPSGTPVGAVLVFNLDFEGELPEGTDIVIDFSEDGTDFPPGLEFVTMAAG